MLKTYDVVCVGGGPGGFSAAIAAARMGRKTLLVERNSYLGGMASTGLGLRMNARVLEPGGSIQRAFIQHMKRRDGWGEPMTFAGQVAYVPVNPELVKLVMLQMCEEAGVELLFSCVPIAAEVAQGRLKQATFYGKGTSVPIGADIFVDATGDGDLADLAGAQSVSGRAQPAMLLFSVCNVDVERLRACAQSDPGGDGVREVCEGRCFEGFERLLAQARKNASAPLAARFMRCFCSAEKGRMIIAASCAPDTDATDPRSRSAGVESASLQALELYLAMRKGFPGFESCRLSGVSQLLGVRESRCFLCRARAGIVSPEESSVARFAAKAGPDAVYGVPLGALLTRDLEGLVLSGRCIATAPEASHTVRSMSACMVIGEAAGVYAALSSPRRQDPVSADEVYAALCHMR